MCKLNGQMGNGRYDDVQMKVDRKGGIMMCKLKGWMDKGRHYVEIKRVDAKGGIMMCELKGRMDKGGYYHVEIKGWLQQGVIWCAN